MMAARMLVLGYVRVSSTEQESGYGPEVQEQAIRSYCLRKKLDGPIIVSESASAESVCSRVEFLQVIKRAKESQALGVPAHVIFHKLDRLARDLIDQETVVLQSLQHGFRLYSTQSAEEDVLNPAYAGDAARTLIRQVFGVFNQFERATIQGRLDSGLAMKARDGGSTGGRMPFGYMAYQGDIVINPEAVVPVRRAFQLQEHGVMMSSILVVLAREHPKLCGHWNKTQLKRVLDRGALYKEGWYRTRLGVAPQRRPELVIVATGETAPISATTPGPIVWSKVPDPVPILTLSLLTGMQATDIQQRVNVEGLAVTWVKGRMLLPHASARAIAGG